MSRHLSLPITALVAGACLLLALTSCSGGPLGSGNASGTPGGSQSSTLTKTAVPGHCDGQIGDRSVDGDVTVPNGATCELRGTRVAGNISVGHGGHLIAVGIDVDGDIEGEGTTAVEVTSGSNVGGNLQLQSGGSAAVKDSHVDGDLSWEEQHGSLEVDGSTVRGNLELDSNTGGVNLSHNEIGGDLSCEENAPAPVGGDNAVSGDADDQCSRL